jgi:hypothetical protein
VSIDLNGPWAFAAIYLLVMVLVPAHPSESTRGRVAFAVAWPLVILFFVLYNLGIRSPMQCFVRHVQGEKDFE